MICPITRENFISRNSKQKLLTQLGKQKIKTAAPKSFKLVREQVSRDLDVAQKGLVAPVAADGQDGQGFGATEVFIGTKRAAVCVALQELVLVHLDLLDPEIGLDVLDIGELNSQPQLTCLAIKAKFTIIQAD